MSLLTRIFVTLLVVLSLLLSAATIVFVSTIDDQISASKAVELSNAQLNAQVAELKAIADLEIKAKDAAIVASNSKSEAAEKASNDARRQLADVGAKLAKAESDLTIASANIAKQASALNALQASNTSYQDQIAQYRTDNERLQTQNGELNVALTESNNKLSVTEERRRLTAEQLTESLAQNDKISGALRDRGVDPNRITASGLTAGAPALNGIVRATTTISGIPHAAISLGSEDAVKVGMEFKVIDRSNGRFLGTLTVVAVEPNEAVGVLKGPDVAAVAAGAEVRTQL